MVFSARLLNSDMSVLATWQVVLVVRDPVGENFP